MGQLSYTTLEIDALLAQTEATEDAAIFGESNQTGVALDGAGTLVQLNNFGLSGQSGGITINPTTGTMTIGNTGVYQINMHCGVTEDVGLKDWELELHWSVNGTPELIDSQYVVSQKANYVSTSVIIARALTAGDVVTLSIASLLKAVTVDVQNSTLEIFRKF